MAWFVRLPYDFNLILNYHQIKMIDGSGRISAHPTIKLVKIALCCPNTKAFLKRSSRQYKPILRQIEINARKVNRKNDTLRGWHQSSGPTQIFWHTNQVELGCMTAPYSAK